MRSFRLRDFPQDKIRVRLKRQTSFLEAFESFSGSSAKALEVLGVSRNVFKAWKNDLLFIPLWAVKRMASEMKLDWNEVDKKIIAYKGVSVSYPISKPILPVKESPELFGLIAHLIADGSVSRGGVPQYINTQKNLIENFKAMLKKTFGVVHGKLYFRKRDKAYFFRFSRVIPILLRHFYGQINFDSEKAILPKRIFRLPPLFAREVIRAFVDDEGAVRDTRIIISLKNKRLIFQLDKLVKNSLGEGSTTVTNRKNIFWVLTIRAHALPRFARIIALKHPKKALAISYALKKLKLRGSGQHEKVWETKLKILYLLDSGFKETKAISRQLLIQTSNIGVHLNSLAKAGLIERKSKRKFAFVWAINKRGRDYLDEKSPFLGKQKT